MHREPAVGAALPRLARLVAIGWASALAFVYLFHYDGWLIPFQAAQLAAGTVSSGGVGPSFVSFVRDRLIDCGCLVALLLTAFGIGAVVVDRLVTAKDLLAGLFALGVGLAVLAVAVLAVGVISVPKVPWVFLAGFGWCLPAPRAFLRRRLIVRSSSLGWAWLAVGVVLVAAVVNLPGAMAPPFEYDELEYHLGALADYIRAGRILFLPHNFYSNLPQLTEMLYLLADLTSSDVAAKLLHWTFGVLTVVAVYALGARLWTKRVGVLAAALFYCLPFVQDLSQTARVDLATTYFATLAFGGLLVWRRGAEEEPEGQRSWLWLSALAAGAAVATKWTAVAVVLLPALGFVLLTRRSWRLAVGYGLLATVVVLPWLIKNWRLTGDPIYPLLAGLVPSPYWSAGQAVLFAEKHYPVFGWDGLRQFGERVWQYSFAEPRAAPLLLMTAPLLLLLGRTPVPGLRAARWAGGLFVAAYAGWWLLTFRPWRFLFPALPLAALVGGCAVAVLGRGRAGRWLLPGAVAVVLAVSGASLVANILVDVEDPGRVPPRLNLLRYTLGGATREEFLTQLGQGIFEPVIWMNHHLPATAKVLYVGEARAYYAQHPALWSTPFDRHPLASMVKGTHGVGELRERLRRSGVTHVYVNFPELQRLSFSYGYLLGIDWSQFRRLLQQQAHSVHESGRRVVYELAP